MQKMNQPRKKKENNPAIPHIESPHYSGLCRRNQQNLPRVPCVEVCSISDKNPETGAFIGKCTQIGPGGCRVILHEVLNKSSIIMINFYATEGEEMIAGIPMTAKVASVHHRKDGCYVFSLDFRGPTFEVHLIERLMIENINKLKAHKESEEGSK